MSDTTVSKTVIDINLMADLHKFGAADINDCFSCGNCTAICPLADNDATFPRRIIRLAQVGLRDDLVASKELWTCYHCGLCTDRCPQEADPAEFMATARRYAIAHYDKSKISRVIYTMPVLGAIIMVVLALVFAAFFASIGARDGTTNSPTLALFKFVPYDVVHTFGLIVMGVTVIFALIGIILLAVNIGRRQSITAKALFGGKAAWARTWRAFWNAVGIESLGQRRYREDCQDDSPVDPLYKRRWLIHLMTVWGFLGLFLATILDYGLDVFGIKATGDPVPIYYPVRLLGTLAGLSLMYGVTMLFLRRLQRTRAEIEVSTYSDWAFLVMLWLIGLSGFLIEIGLYLPGQQIWGYWVFLVHVAIAMELVLFLPFTKFAHVMYRPVALFFYGLAKEKV